MEKNEKKDPMVSETQEWLNDTYLGDSRFTKVKLSGHTGWPTIHGLILAFQIELGLQDTSPNFGDSTIAMFKKTFPEGIKQQNQNDNTKKQYLYYNTRSFMVQRVFNRFTTYSKLS